MSEEISDTGELVDRLHASRERLCESIKLLNRAVNLRAHLWWQPDLDDARADVDALKRECAEYKRGRKE